MGWKARIFGSWRACNTHEAQLRKTTCMNKLGNGISFLVISVTSKLLFSALTEDPRLARISLFLQENEANPLEKRINTDSLLWTQQSQCRSIRMGRVKGKPKYVILILGPVDEKKKKNPLEDQEAYISTTFFQSPIFPMLPLHLLKGMKGRQDSSIYARHSLLFNSD